MSIQISQWWLSIKIDYVCWADFHLVSVAALVLAYVLFRKALNWWRWRHADNAEYYLTEDGWDKL
jgi:hypothetical protein